MNEMRVKTVTSLAEFLGLSLRWVLSFLMFLLHYNLTGAVTSIPYQGFFDLQDYLKEK